MFNGVSNGGFGRVFSMKISLDWWLSRIVNGKVGRNIGVDWGRLPNAAYCFWLSKSKLVEGDIAIWIEEFDTWRTV